MIATIKPTLSAAEESISTLDFAFRAKNIKNTPTIIQRSSKKVVLKEYLAEMEQLRAQLQITREKNGVYVDPTQYAAMEAKVARLTESEAALREANEENRNLKKEVEDVTHKLGNAEIRLGSTMRQLDDLTGKLASLENELNTLQIERMAAEAVVNAQATNEQTLRSQGAALQSEVLSNRDDIHRLFEKINGLGVKEHQRVLDTQEVLGDINLKKSHLLVSLEAATELNTAKQLEFCEGISELLAKGRSTCDVLKRAIEEALPVFLDDASASSESIATASVELQTHLSNVTAGTEAALRELHLQLSMWVGEVTTTAEIMQVQLDDQQTQVTNG
jgi:kinesin family protein 11